MFTKVYFIACLLLIIYSVYGIDTLNKSDVLSIKVKKDKDGQCPPYSMGPYNDEDVCSFRFFCRDEVCYPVTNNSTNTVEFTNKSGQVETYNIDHWTESYESSKKACSNDSDCFSNKCKKGFCTLNENSELTQCMDSYSYQYKSSIFKFSYSVSMNCGKAAHVKCSSDDECASNNCVNGECNNDNYKPVGKTRAFLYGGIILAVFFLFVGLLIYLICRCCRGSSRNRGVPYYPDEKKKNLV
ncbi:hypothetical protein PIROE2DRAFT_16719 [Piromyces sp. E2]|nr:hypothetical protein PIROE2DRAFT_16719 [Piromyces sp. E2]|eukprot:OUM58106.1 hypothetical protein PIROE2DRAFT_16719 [Piromyces sp. E2]